MRNDSYTGGIAPRAPGESDKLYAKRVVDHLPAPASHHLSDEPARYFLLGPGAVPMHLQLLQVRGPDQVPAESIARALKRLAAAGEGALARRAPLDVAADGQGRYRVLDGSSTLAAARLLGWVQLPARVLPVSPDDTAPADSGTVIAGRSASPQERAIDAALQGRRQQSIAVRREGPLPDQAPPTPDRSPAAAHP